MVFITKASSRISFFISRIGKHHGFSGFPGLFLAVVTAHSLSFISTGFNAIAEKILLILSRVGFAYSRIHYISTQ